MDKSQVPNPNPPRCLADQTNHKSQIQSENHEYETRNMNTDLDISWIDDFVEKVKPYIYVRELDRLLILIPNQTYKLNPSGVSILSYLLKGRSINELLAIVGNTAEKRREIHYFFCDLRALISGCLRDHEKRAAISYYEFNGQLSAYPVLSEIAVTYRCNLGCEFCYIGNKTCPQLDTNDTKKILFKIFHEAKVPSVSFTGGEPLLRRDICSLVEYASKIGLWTNLISNGTLFNKVLVKELKRGGLSSCQISVEGPNSLVHDRITGVQGSFNATIAGVKLLLEAEIPVHTNTTVSLSNLKHLEDIVLMAKGLGLERLSMNLLIPCGTAATKRDLWVKYADIGAHILELKHRAEQEHMKFLWYSPVPICKFNPIAHGFGNKSCAALTGLLSIDPMGNIIPCSSWPMPVGSLLKQTFEKIWQSPMLSYFKNVDYAPQVCHECKHLDVCKGACPLYWKSCGLEELNGRT